MPSRSHAHSLSLVEFVETPVRSPPPTKPSATRAGKLLDFLSKRDPAPTSEPHPSRISTSTSTSSSSTTASTASLSDALSDDTRATSVRSSISRASSVRARQEEPKPHPHFMFQAQRKPGKAPAPFARQPDARKEGPPAPPAKDARSPSSCPSTAASSISSRSTLSHQSPIPTSVETDSRKPRQQRTNWRMDFVYRVADAPTTVSPDLHPLLRTSILLSPSSPHSAPTPLPKSPLKALPNSPPPRPERSPLRPEPRYIIKPADLIAQMNIRELAKRASEEELGLRPATRCASAAGRLTSSPGGRSMNKWPPAGRIEIEPMKQEPRVARRRMRSFGGDDGCEPGVAF